MACKMIMPSVAMIILDHCTDDILSFTDHITGSNPFMLACNDDSGSMSEVANRLLDKKDKYDIGSTNDSGETALMMAIWSGMTDVVNRLLEDIDNCNLAAIDNDGNTALIAACEEEMPEIAMKILQYHDKCSLGSVDKEDNTAFTLACMGGMTDVAMKLLEYRDMFDIGMINFTNSTALIYACEHQMREIALEIMKDIDKCNHHIVNTDGHSALSWAYTHDMMDIVDILEPYNTYIQAYKKYQNKHKYTDDIDDRIKRLEELNDRLENRVNSKDCTVCYEDTKQSVFMLKCKHVVLLCDDCANNVENKCPLCGFTGPIIRDVFVV